MVRTRYCNNFLGKSIFVGKPPPQKKGLRRALLDLDDANVKSGTLEDGTYNPPSSLQIWGFKPMGQFLLFFPLKNRHCKKDHGVLKHPSLGVDSNHSFQPSCRYQNPARLALQGKLWGLEGFWRVVSRCFQLASLGVFNWFPWVFSIGFPGCFQLVSLGV